MMGKPQRRECKLFYTGLSLEDRVPADHRLRRISSAVSFASVRAAVADRYGYNGHESLDPVLVLKLMLLLFLEQVTSERELMRQLPLRLDWLWFCEMDLDDTAPDHSVLSKARRRWGLEVFESLFCDVLSQCKAAGLIDGSTVYADSTVLKADASVDSRVARKLWQQLERGLGDGQDDEEPPPSRPAPPQDTQAAQLPDPPTGPFNVATVSTTDPDAATTRRAGKGVTLGYRDHCLVDDHRGVVIATIATAADYDDAHLLTSLIDKQRQYLSHQPARVVGDSGYGTQQNLEGLRAQRIKPYLKRRPGRGGGGKHDRGWIEKMSADGPPSACVRYQYRRLAVAEGRFADAHTRHGHRRCRWRRRWRVQIQCYLVAMAQNIRKLARYRPGPRRPAAPTASRRLLHSLNALTSCAAPPTLLHA